MILKSPYSVYYTTRRATDHLYTLTVLTEIKKKKNIREAYASKISTNNYKIKITFLYFNPLTQHTKHNITYKRTLGSVNNASVCVCVCV